MQKFLIFGSLVGGLVIFIWGSVTHAFLPWPESYLREFADNKSVIETIKANTRGNGVYYAPEGIFATISFRPDMSDRSQDMNKFLVIEYITDIIAAFLIAILMLQLKTGGIVNRAVIVLIMGLAGGVATHIPEWNWWGFSTIYTVVEFFDHVMGWFFAGLALSALMEKWVPAANRA